MEGFFKDIDFARIANDDSVSLLLVLWALIFGIIVAAIIIFFKRSTTGELVRAILEAGAVDEASAKTLRELGQEGNASAIAALCASPSMRRMVGITPPPAEGKRGAVALSEESRLYISSEGMTRARVQYGAKKESFLGVLLGAIGLVAVGICITLLM